MLFAAYPAEPSEIATSIEDCERRQDGALFQTWRSIVGIGGLIDKNILPKIERSDGLICDLTFPNNNVFFEIGFAIGCKKPIIPIINTSVKEAGKYLKKIGLFDNIVQIRYQNAHDLHNEIINYKNNKPIFVDEISLNPNQPIYIIDAYRRSEFASKIISAVKSHLVSFRSFDPQEEYRLSLRSAWDNACQSTGIIVSILNKNKDDEEFHNLRSSFFAGLSISLKRETLILLDSEVDAPLDFIDNAKRIKHPDDIGDAIKDFGVKALARSVEERRTQKPKNLPLLKRVSAGASAAENELRRLENYFVETSPYTAALEGRGRLVVGRKGSGKTAIFWRVRDKLRSDTRNSVIDLKPDGYQLRKFKEQLVKLLQAGTKDHTLTAFWEYLILVEILLKILEDDQHKFYGRDPKITTLLDVLIDLKDNIEHSQEGDFSERMMSLIQQVSSRFKEKFQDNEKLKTFLSTEQITELLHEYNINKFQEKIFSYLKMKSRTVVLFDNIDKGWGAHGIDDDDIVIVSSIVEAFRKIERAAARKDVELNWLLLLRNDVYELLIDKQPDRGKEDRIIVDWDSKNALKELINNRIRSSTESVYDTVGVNWDDICPAKIDGSESLEWMIERCSMKPRFLIKLASECIGAASTSQSKYITEEHVFEGYRLFSIDALENTNLDMRDILPEAENVVYSFIGMPRKLTLADARQLILDYGHSSTRIDEIIRLLFWFGFLGIVTRQNSERYIYDFRYNEKIFSQSRKAHSREREEVVINLAFSGALDCLEN